MLRELWFLGAALCAGTAAWALAAYGPGSDVREFLRVLAVVGLLALAVAMPVWLSMRADRERMPWRAAARFLVRESPLEGAVLLMLAASMVLALWPFANGSTVGAIALGGAAVAFVVAAALEHLFPYVPEPAPAAAR